LHCQDEEEEEATINETPFQAPLPCSGLALSSLMESCPITEGTTLTALAGTSPFQGPAPERRGPGPNGGQPRVTTATVMTKPPFLHGLISSALRLHDIKHGQLGTALSLHPPFSLRPETF